MYSEIAANKRKTIFLLFGFFVLVGAIAYGAAWYFNDYFITIFALVFAIGYALWGYFASDKTALSMNNAIQIQKKDNPRLWRIVENLSITTGIPMPKVHIIEDNALNAFATGRDPNHASVAITTGLLATLTDDELEGVMAHELGHIQNYDIRVMMITFGLVAVISIISDILLRSMLFGRDNRGNGNPYMLIAFVVALVLAPLVATLVKLAVSRKREYLADATGALTTRYPDALASALQKIATNGAAMHKQNTSTAHLFIANPLKGQSLSNLFSTHPPIEERIQRLHEMGRKA